MKENMTLCVAAFAACAVASCACAATSWTDYFGGTAPASGTVAIAAGDEVVVIDAEMAASAACTVNVAAGARLLLNTSTFPTFAFGTKCYGTVEKVSAGDWAVASKNQSNFKGTYVVSGGTLGLNGTYYKVFGGVDAVNNGNVRARPGSRHSSPVAFTTSDFTQASFPTVNRKSSFSSRTSPAAAPPHNAMPSATFSITRVRTLLSAAITTSATSPSTSITRSGKSASPASCPRNANGWTGGKQAAWWIPSGSSTRIPNGTAGGLGVPEHGREM